MENNRPLFIAGCLSFIASFLHLMYIWGGPDWYLALGAGEEMANLAAAEDPYPTIVTSTIATILALWGLYAFSGAGLILKLPLLKTGLVLISAIYSLRGAGGLLAPFVTNSPMIQQNSTTFWLLSSLICCVYGTFYVLGTIRLWGERNTL